MITTGQQYYIPSTCSISNGSEDVAGGLATVSSVDVSDHLPKDHYNAVMVSFKELPGKSYNANYILENQDKWERIYKGQVAHPDPDEDQPWIEDGDIVNGQVYHGKTIY